MKPIFSFKRSDLSAGSSAAGICCLKGHVTYPGKALASSYEGDVKKGRWTLRP